MKKLPLLLAALLLAAQNDDLQPGLVAEYFALKEGPANFPSIPATQKPTLVRVEKTVDYPEVSGDFYGTRLVENFYARWTGVLRVDKPGPTNFFAESDDGSRVTIDG